MCGIAGIIHFDRERQVDKSTLTVMRDTLKHRGPDDKDLFIDKNIGLAHRRLSILDLSPMGKQPFQSADQQLIITFNGEIYNFQALRDDLQSKGYQFRSKTDTEVLLYLYREYGVDMLNRLNGMFAFVIYDKKKQKVFGARDRLGIKPFYYSIFENSFYFGSEPKAIFRAGVPAEISEVHFNELMLFRFVAGENSVFKQVKRLLPGHYFEIQNGDYSFHKWWDLGNAIKAKAKFLYRKSL